MQFTTAPQPPDAIEVRVADEMSADPRVQMPLARVGDHIRLRDPHDRSAIDVVPVLASGLGMVSMHRFPNFDLLATAQGVAARGPGQIDVFATLAGIDGLLVAEADQHDITEGLLRVAVVRPQLRCKSVVLDDQPTAFVRHPEGARIGRYETVKVGRHHDAAAGRAHNKVGHHRVAG